MVDCKECSDYVNGLFNRGEITKDEIDKVILDRHALKGCAKKIDPFKNWLDFAIENQRELHQEHIGIEFPEWNKGYLEALLDARQRYSATNASNDNSN